MNERQLAVDAVLKACRLCNAVHRGLISAGTLDKKDRSPVTVADFGVQAVVTAELRRRLGDMPIVGEEEAGALRKEENAGVRDLVIGHVRAILPDLDDDTILAQIDYGRYAGGPTGRHWALDPIDGTKGFLRGDQYAIALGLIDNGQVVLGVLGCPNLPLRLGQPDSPRGCLFVGEKDRPAVMRAIDGDSETPIHVSNIDDPSRASFCESVEKEHTKQSDSARVAAILGVTAEPVRIDSQCKYGVTARGESSIYLRMPTRADYEERIWDHAAGWAVIKSAGGEVTDIHGKPLDFSLGTTLRSNKGVVATNGCLHQRVIDAIDKAISL